MLQPLPVGLGVEGRAGLDGGRLGQGRGQGQDRQVHGFWRSVGLWDGVGWVCGWTGVWVSCGFWGWALTLPSLPLGPPVQRPFGWYARESCPPAPPPKGRKRRHAVCFVVFLYSFFGAVVPWGWGWEKGVCPGPLEGTPSHPVPSHHHPPHKAPAVALLCTSFGDAVGQSFVRSRSTFWSTQDLAPPGRRLKINTCTHISIAPPPCYVEAWRSPE